MSDGGRGTAPSRPASRARRRRTAVVGAIAVTALLAIYAGLILVRAISLVRTGTVVGVLIGIGAIILPLVVVGLIAAEFRLATTVQRMADALAEAGELPVDDLPRSPGGRIDREAADEQFPRFRRQVEEHPDDWRAWYNIAFAYEASRDKKRARESLRRAATLYRGERRSSRG